MLSDVEKENLNRMITHIEENLRAGSKSGLDYVDPRDFKSRFASLQNHVVFGRRGAGKSMLLDTLQKDKSPKPVIVVQLNLEDFKDVSFPNIIIKVLSEALKGLHQTLDSRRSFWHPLTRKAILNLMDTIQKEIHELLLRLDEPDEFAQKEMVRSTESNEDAVNLTVTPTPKFKLDYKDGTKAEGTRERAREVSYSKLDFLRKRITEYKSTMNAVSVRLDNAQVFLVLDDFYFLPKSIQPDFIDYLHRIAKDTPLFLKIATIKHRTVLFKKSAESYIGTELNHDIFPIDLDYTLDNFKLLVEFMDQIVQALYAKFDAPRTEKLFAGDGFSQLCLASGGVPRDFLTLFVVLLRKISNGEIERIGKIDVTDIAITNFSSKMEALRTDGAEEGSDLELYLNSIKQFVVSEKRTNTFLVAKQELDTYPIEKQALRELLDLRFFHLVDANISAAPSDGRQYEAYLVDLGLYPNTRPRNFNQIDPTAHDEKSRRDQLRSSPRIDLKKLNSDVGQQVRNLTVSTS